MKNLFVGNMSFDTTEGELRALFEPFGEITRIQVITDRDTGRPRGFAFVEMTNDEEATQAMRTMALDGKEVGGRALKVNEARPRPERSRSFGEGGGGGGRGGGGGGGRFKREPRW